MRQTRVAFLDVYILAMIPPALLLALAVLAVPAPFWGAWAAGGLALILIYSVEINRIRSIYKITPNQVVMEKGILKKTRKAVFFDNIVDVNFKQGYLQRFLNYGTITVGSSGGRTHEECEIIFEKVRKPQHFVNEIEIAMKSFGRHPLPDVKS